MKKRTVYVVFVTFHVATDYLRGCYPLPEEIRTIYVAVKVSKIFVTFYVAIVTFYVAIVTFYVAIVTFYVAKTFFYSL